MCQSWLRVALAAVCLMVVGGCDSSQKQAADAPAQKPSTQQEAEAAPDMSEQKSTGTDAAAGQQEQGSQSIWVMESRGNLQCEGGGKSLASSGAELAQNGIRVQESRCGVRTDRMYPSVCGGITGDLLLHRIPANFLDAALELGFDPARSEQYKFVDCPQMKPGSSPDQR